MAQAPIPQRSKAPNKFLRWPGDLIQPCLDVGTRRSHSSYSKPLLFSLSAASLYPNLDRNAGCICHATVVCEVPDNTALGLIPGLPPN